MTDPLRTLIEESIQAKEAILADEDLLERTRHITELLTEAARSGAKVIFFGNGGSAADATHLAAEFVGKFRFDRPPLPALSLTDNGSSISAIGNDYAYEEVFARQMAAFARPGDVAVALSTSGASANVVRGLEEARRLDVRTVAITGQRDSACAQAAEVCLRMPASATARVQECYMLLCHAMCEMVESAIFQAPATS